MTHQTKNLVHRQSETYHFLPPEEEDYQRQRETQAEDLWSRRKMIDEEIGTNPQKAKLALLVILLIFIVAWLGKDPSSPNTQLLIKKQVPDVLTVHLIAHSHDDVGWIKTVDDYFYGGNLGLRSGGVQYTIDTVLTELTEHPQYKFVIVEMAFLYRWWRQASEKQKKKMKNLLNNGQLQFINGGWCASDEATIYYEDFIDQMAVGLRWMKETFDYVPDVAWHIDPFGHHSSTASLFRQMGYNSLFFARIDYQDKISRKKNKALQLIWKPPQLTGSPSEIFTHIQYFHYSPPWNFYFDSIIYRNVIKDDPTLEGYNLDIKAKQFVSWFKEQSQYYRTKNIMHTIGQDFTYMNARMQFKNFQKLVRYINSHPQFKIQIKFSTPNDYLKAVRKEKQKYPTKTDDFFPYSDYQHAFWTGFFTSRVALKGFVKDFSRFFLTAKKHISELKIANSSDIIKNNSKLIEKIIFKMEMAHGILQHHDAVAGTATQNVSNDYVATGLRAINEFNEVYARIKKEEIQKETGESVTDLYINLFWNETGEATGLSKSLNQGKNVLVSFYNPGSKGTYPIRLKVPLKDLNIMGQNNSPISGDVVCANLRDSSDCELLFNLDIGESSNAYVKLSVSALGSAKQVKWDELSENSGSKEFGLGDDKLILIPSSTFFDLRLGQLTYSFKLFYNYYLSWNLEGQKSGAYIFRPKLHTSKLYSKISKIYSAEGSTAVVIVLLGDKTLTRIYFSKALHYVRNYGFLIQTQISSISISDNEGKEVTLNLKTDLFNDLTFYTDSMGLEQQERKINYRPSWDLKVFQPAAGNYYPINSFIRIKDSGGKRSVSILTDRSQGGSALRQGQIQIMIHRRCLMDDERGVEEPLNQTDSKGKGLTQIVRHYVVFGDRYRELQKWNDQRILPSFGQSDSNIFSKNPSVRQPPIFVPQSVKLYLRPFEDGSYLLRFHNMNVINSTTIDLNGWFLQEMTLAGNQKLSQWMVRKEQWMDDGTQDQRKIPEGIFSHFMSNSRSNLNELSEKISKTLEETARISLKPFEMKTFKGIPK